MSKCAISFEQSEPPNELFGEASTYTLSVHEALCQAIHEGNPEALNWLASNVDNIEVVDVEELTDDQLLVAAEKALQTLYYRTVCKRKGEPQ